jgi:acetyltransferase-like isoleucine patch superfamily enzyme
MAAARARRAVASVGHGAALRQVAGKAQWLWNQPLMAKLDTLSLAYYRVKTQVFYRRVFKSLGPGTTIRRPLMISHPEYITVGKNVLIRDGARLETPMTRPGRAPDLRIGDNTNIEQNVHIICHNRVHIGPNVSITGHCAIVDVTHPYEDIANGTKIGARIQDDDAAVEIGAGSFIGYGSVILPNTRIGRHVVVGANSVVTRDVPDYSVVSGVPARLVRRYDSTLGRWVGVARAEAGEAR